MIHFALSSIMMMGYYCICWRNTKSLINTVKLDTKYFPNHFKKTPMWMRKNHDIMQRWIPDYLYYYGLTIHVGPLIVVIITLAFVLADKPPIDSYTVVFIILIIGFLKTMILLIMTRIYVGSWRKI